MKKKLLPVILVCCMLSAWLTAYAHADDIVASGDCGANGGSNVQWTLDNSGHLTISGQGEMGSYLSGPWYDYEDRIISATINEGVTNVGSGAFSFMEHLTRVALPDSVLVIESFAFNGCSSLLSINIPENVTSIGQNAFSVCNALTDVYFTGTESMWNAISIDSGNTPLENAHIHSNGGNNHNETNSVVARGNCGADGSNVQWTLDSGGHLSITGSGAIRDYGRSFYQTDDWGTTYSDAPWYVRETATTPYYENHNMVTSLIIGEGITCIGENAFLGLTQLTVVTLPNSLTRIKECAFQRCTSLTHIDFPAGVTSLEAGVLFYCSDLLEFTISDTVTSIDGSAFRNCDHLTRITIPNSVDYMGRFVFQDCDRLQSVRILGEIPLIRARAFVNCPALTEVTIPGSVEVIEEAAFSGCDALTDVYFTGTESMWNEISVDGENMPLGSATVHFDTSVEATYRINSLSISDMTGNPLTEIPNGVFLQTVSVTNRASGGTPVIFVAAYAADGQFLNYAYVTVKEPVGGTVEVTLPVDNSGGNIAQLKAFAVRSFGGLEPIGNLVTFPAQ